MSVGRQPKHIHNIHSILQWKVPLLLHNHHNAQESLIRIIQWPTEVVSCSTAVRHHHFPIYRSLEASQGVHSLFLSSAALVLAAATASAISPSANNAPCRRGEGGEGRGREGEGEGRGGTTEILHLPSSFYLTHVQCVHTQIHKRIHTRHILYMCIPSHSSFWPVLPSSTERSHETLH